MKQSHSITMNIILDRNGKKFVLSNNMLETLEDIIRQAVDNETEYGVVSILCKRE